MIHQAVCCNTLFLHCLPQQGIRIHFRVSFFLPHWQFLEGIRQAGVLFWMSALVPCPSGRLTKSITRTLRSFAGPASSVVFTRTGYIVKSMILQLCFLMPERVSFSYVIPTSKTGHPRFFRASKILQGIRIFFCRIWSMAPSADLFHFSSITKAGQSESWRGRYTTSA